MDGYRMGISYYVHGCEALHCKVQILGAVRSLRTCSHWLVYIW